MSSIRSFVKRKGRITSAQKRALQTLSDNYLLNIQEPLDLQAAFGRDAPCHMEIGFGMGECLLAMAQTHPDYNYLGIDVYDAGIGSVMNNLSQSGMENVRVISHDAKEIVAEYLPASCLDAAYIFFPDPWPKKRHHKRRLIQPDFVSSLVEVIKPGGKIRLATDWEEYAYFMLAVMDSQPALYNPIGWERFGPRPKERPLTKFERRGQRLGHRIWDLLYIKKW